ncbi:MAG: hypothetical protein EOP28_02325 [Rhodococcus sp. (in: high G+C Gram-positive bacteria)]|nr:MAG: hypothetical protein EOP28_02325 [Rhodococcus sp. (in: high G+C Gram-positive bacteria)]
MLCNFGVINQLGLLEMVLNGRGKWTEAVEDEAHNSARYIPALSAPALAFLGDAVEVDDPDDIDAIQRIRRARFGGMDPNKPREHLGEAETCYVIMHNSAYTGSKWITDDRDALEFAKRQQIDTWETWHVMSEAVVNGYVTEYEGFDLLLDIERERPGLRRPKRPAELRQ